MPGFTLYYTPIYDAETMTVTLISPLINVVVYLKFI